MLTVPDKERVAVPGSIAGILALEGSVGVASDGGGDVLLFVFYMVSRSHLPELQSWEILT